VICFAIALCWIHGGSARAEQPAEPPRATYSHPWLLRPGLVPNVARLDFPVVLQNRRGADPLHTLTQLIRLRGELATRTRRARTSRGRRTFARWLSISAEMHAQHWLGAVRADAWSPSSVVGKPETKDQLTLGGGIRLNVPLPGGRMIRPGVAFFPGPDDPVGAAAYWIAQLDLPFFY